MPSCKVFGCSNTSGKTPGIISYFHFPDPAKEKARAERWLINISTGYTSYKRIQQNEQREVILLLHSGITFFSFFSQVSIICLHLVLFRNQNFQMCA